MSEANTDRPPTRSGRQSSHAFVRKSREGLAERMEDESVIDMRCDNTGGGRGAGEGGGVGASSERVGNQAAVSSILSSTAFHSDDGNRNKVLPRKASIRSDINRSNSGSVGIKSKDVQSYHPPLNIRTTDRDYEENYMCVPVEERVTNPERVITHLNNTIYEEQTKSDYSTTCENYANLMTRNKNTNLSKIDQDDSSQNQETPSAEPKRRIVVKHHVYGHRLVMITCAFMLGIGLLVLLPVTVLTSYTLAKMQQVHENVDIVADEMDKETRQLERSTYRVAKKLNQHRADLAHMSQKHKEEEMGDTIRSLRNLFKLRRSPEGTRCQPTKRIGYQKYFASNHTGTLQQAMRFCKYYCGGASLASPAKVHHIPFLLKVSRHDKVWSAFRTIDDEGKQWRPSFQDGLPPDWLKTFWAKGYPEILDDDLITCAYMDKKSKLLHSTSCEQKHHFLCLKNI
ncbi:uncharacterized protein LOC142342172 isoform X2 [Convolutriloba macropyga]|uniref:uncharacterized protein LOC142342172 isoform X2 n=1 Tax=Convolutriloba macropyga TaxID=536237 RepID=UPI003F524D76